MTELLAAALPGVTPWGYVALGLLVLVGACLQGIGGIGFAMFAAPVAALAYPVMVPGPLLLLGGLVSVMAALRERSAIEWCIAGHCVLGRCLGAGAAVALMSVLSPRPLGVAFGLSLLAAVGFSLAGWRIVPDTRSAWAAGAASGLMGTITSVGAPPLGLLTQQLAPAAIRSTIGCVIALGAATSLALLAAGGLFTLRQAVLGLALFPWVWVGFRISSRLSHRISASGMKRLLLGLVAGSALLILFKAAIG